MRRWLVLSRRKKGFQLVVRAGLANDLEAREQTPPAIAQGLHHMGGDLAVGIHHPQRRR